MDAPHKVYFSHVNVSNPRAIHPLFKDTLSNPPQGYVYINREFFTSTNNTETEKQSSIIRGLIGAARLMKRVTPLPTIWRIPMCACDLIHASSHLAICDKPWVFDYEAVHCLTQFNPNHIKKPHVKAIVRRFLKSKNCKHLIAMSEVARKGFVHLFPDLAGKTSVVYPAPIITEKMRAAYEQRIRNPKRAGDSVTFLFAARYFRMKGGYETLEAFKQVHAKHPQARLIIAGGIPDELKDAETEGVTFTGMVSREEMITKHYPAADVFVSPTFFDTFGYVILEAMAFGMPCISTDDNVMPEIIDDGIDGILVPSYSHHLMDENSIMRPEYMDFERLYQDTRPEFNRMAANIAKAMERVLDRPRLINAMGRAGFEKVSTGKFSAQERNKRLKSIYDKALGLNEQS